MHAEEHKPTHRQHHPLHDYRERCIYHITLVCSNRAQVLGQIKGQDPGSAACHLTPLGMAISREIQLLPDRCAAKGRKVQVLAKVVMPEHLHMVLFVQEPMDCRLQLILRGFKQGCNKRMRQWLAQQDQLMQEVKNLSTPDGKTTQPFTQSPYGAGATQPIAQSPCGAGATQPFTQSPCGAGVAHSLICPPLPSDWAAFPRQWCALHATPRIVLDHALFEEDFDETRLRRRGQLRAMIDYVHNNPAHRWQRQRNPSWLLPMRGIQIEGQLYDAIGNVNLLALTRHQVWIRSRWDEATRRQYQNDCILRARQGAALVSPFISPHEAAVRDVALREGHSVIVLTDNGFSSVSQCPGNLYDYCTHGQVLILVPSEFPHLDRKSAITRQECVLLNERAREIVGHAQGR